MLKYVALALALCIFVEAGEMAFSFTLAIFILIHVRSLLMESIIASKPLNNRDNKVVNRAELFKFGAIDPKTLDLFLWYAFQIESLFFDFSKRWKQRQNK
jgi:hypothetical protein